MFYIKRNTMLPLSSVERDSETADFSPQRMSFY